MQLNTRGPGQPTWNITRYVFLLITAYALALSGFDLYAKSIGIAPKLSNMVDVCKAVSLLSLIFVGGEMAWHREHFGSLPITSGRSWFVFAAKLVFTISVIVFVVLILKILVSSLQVFGSPKDFPQSGKQLYSFISFYVTFAAMFPIFAYSCLNGYLAFVPLKGADDLSQSDKALYYRSKRRGVHFFIYSNLSVLVPLIGILALLALGHYHAGIEERDTFLSGALAVILMVSSICAKAVEEYSSANAA